MDPVKEDKKKKKKKKKKDKKKKNKEKKSEEKETLKRSRDEEEEDVERAVVHPFPVLEEDHCETPEEAYVHLVPFLDRLCDALGKTRETLSIYDPYFCAGGMVKRLNALGFARVYNENEDCYKCWHKKEYDVLVTNPPYSQDHIEKLVSFLSTRPEQAFAILVPNFVVKKPFHRTLLEPWRPFYLVPKSRYVYLPPAGMRAKKKSDTHKKNSPFVTIWHLYGGRKNNRDVLEDLMVKDASKDEYSYCRSRNALRDLRRK